MASVVVDTDVISFAFKKDSRIRGFRRHLIGRDWIISFMTLAELELWALGRNWSRATRERLERHLQAYQVQLFGPSALSALGGSHTRRTTKGPAL